MSPQFAVDLEVALEGTRVDVGESAESYVRYQNDKTDVTIERRYEAALRQRGDRVTALPKCLYEDSPALFQSVSQFCSQRSPKLVF